MMPYRFATVDVGMHTAIAVFKNNTLTENFLLNIDKSLNDVDAIRSCTQWFASIIKNTYVSDVYIEGIQIYTNSSKSITSAAKGDTVWVAYLVGALVQACGGNVVPHIVLPREWKGSMSKIVTQNRLKLITNETYNEHVADAIAMGFSLLGKL